MRTVEQAENVRLRVVQSMLKVVVTAKVMEEATGALHQVVTNTMWAEAIVWPTEELLKGVKHKVAPRTRKLEGIVLRTGEEEGVKQRVVARLLKVEATARLTEEEETRLRPY